MAAIVCRSRWHALAPSPRGAGCCAAVAMLRERERTTLVLFFAAIDKMPDGKKHLSAVARAWGAARHVELIGQPLGRDLSLETNLAAESLNCPS